MREIEGIGDEGEMESRRGKKEGTVRLPLLLLLLFFLLVFIP